MQYPLCRSPGELHLFPPAALPVQSAQLTGLSPLPWLQAKKGEGPLYTLSDQTSFWKNVSSVGITQPPGPAKPPYSLKMPPAPQSGQAVWLQSMIFAGLKSIVFWVILTFSVFHMQPSHQSS